MELQNCISKFTGKNLEKTFNDKILLQIVHVGAAAIHPLSRLASFEQTWWTSFLGSTKHYQNRKGVKSAINLLQCIEQTIIAYQIYVIELV